MHLQLEDISKKSGAQTWLYPQSLGLVPDAVTVLLGATQAGKTSLMRIMAGLDQPSSGRVLVDGKDVTGVPVRKRNVAMVYQQFINYPSLTVAENIASPLRLRRERNIAQRVQELAERLHIEAFLERHPQELSGGQQQRVALARALAKDASLMLLDEPLVNLDYKLREELREDLGLLFQRGNATVVYATTEPGEALLLGGYTAVMGEGELLQYGPTAEVFRRPQTLRVARAFSDPPLNVLPGAVDAGGVRLAGGTLVPAPHAFATDSAVTVGLRASSLRVRKRPGDVSLPARVGLVEMSGSDTFVYASTASGDVVAQLGGVHRFELDEALEFGFNPVHAYFFDARGDLLTAPAALEP